MKRTTIKGVYSRISETLKFRGEGRTQKKDEILKGTTIGEAKAKSEGDRPGKRGAAEI